MVLTPEEQAIIEERFEVLEERNKRLERLIRSGKAFTNNPLVLTTDLDDLGSVKTHLDFEEAPLTPVTPPEDVMRLYAADGPSTATGGRATVPTFVDSAGVTTIIDAGLYTPTLTNGPNVAASTTFELQWMRIGDVVVVSGVLNLDPISGGINTLLGISLPVASNLGAVTDLGGTGAGSLSPQNGGNIRGNIVTDVADLRCTPASAVNQAWAVIFQYQII